MEETSRSNAAPAHHKTDAAQKRIVVFVDGDTVQLIATSEPIPWERKKPRQGAPTEQARQNAKEAAQ